MFIDITLTVFMIEVNTICSLCVLLYRIDLLFSEIPYIDVFLFVDF